MTASSIMSYILPRVLLFPSHDWDDDKEIEQIVQFVMYGLSGKR
jgi:hypothetical protein